jgi:hypothetical protein
MKSLLLLSLLFFSCSLQNTKKALPAVLPALPVPVPLDAKVTESLKDFTFKAMETCGVDFSVARKNTLANTIAQVIPSYIKERKEQELFVILLCVESKYDNKGKSSAGAVGIAQILPKYAQNFSNLCNMGDLRQGDAEDLLINLSLGACLFNSLHLELKSSMLSFAAYNAGLRSDAVRSMAGLGTMNKETANYVAKAAFLKEKLDADKTDTRSIPDGERERVSSNGTAGSKLSSPPVSDEKAPIPASP